MKFFDKIFGIEAKKNAIIERMAKGEFLVHVLTKYEETFYWQDLNKTKPEKKIVQRLLDEDEITKYQETAFDTYILTYYCLTRQNPKKEVKYHKN